MRSLSIYPDPKLVCTIGKRIFPFTLLFRIFIISHIFFTVGKRAYAESVNLIHREFAFIFIAIWPSKNTWSMSLAFMKISLVHGRVGPCFFSFAMPEAILPSSFISVAVFQGTDTEAVGLPIFPFAIILVPILLSQGALTICPTVCPSAFLYIPIFAHNSTLATHFIKAPIALVFLIILPGQHSVPML